jgi:hypothetical protein
MCMCSNIPVEHVMSDRYHTHSATMHACRISSSANDSNKAVIIQTDPSRCLPRPLQSATNYITNTDVNIGVHAAWFSPMPFTHEWLMSPDQECKLEDILSPPPLSPGVWVIECVNCQNFFDVSAIAAGHGTGQRCPQCDYMWQLHCGHMLDSDCLNKLGWPSSALCSTSSAFFVCCP